MGEHFRRPAGHGHVAHDDCIIAHNDVFDKWFGIAALPTAMAYVPASRRVKR
ncbi:MAG: hypothetical protein ACM30E_12140 [Nitrososphaerales archaeon]